MANVAATIRDLINRDREATEPALRLMALRAEMSVLIGLWKAAGGGDRLPDLPERAREPRRVALPKPLSKSVSKNVAAKRARVR